MKNRLFLLTILVVCFLVYVSCTKDKAMIKPLDPITKNISFDTVVRPIMELNCATSGCHDAGTAANGYMFNTYDNIKLNAIDGLSAMKGINGKTPMPLGKEKLPDSTIAQFEAWINQGMLNN